MRRNSGDLASLAAVLGAFDWTNPDGFVDAKIRPKYKILRGTNNIVDVGVIATINGIRSQNMESPWISTPLPISDGSTWLQSPRFCTLHLPRLPRNETRQSLQSLSVRRYSISWTQS